MDFTTIWQHVSALLLSTGIRILIIFILALVLIRVSRVLSRRVTSIFLDKKKDEETKKRASTLANVINKLLNVVIWIFALITVLGQLNIEIGPLLAAAGIFGLAIGFAGQSLVKDYLNGFYLLLWDQIRIGDVVQIAGKGGLVEDINLKMTTIRDLAGNLHFIPNGIIDAVTNMTKEFSRYVFEIGVAYREDVDEVIEVVKKIDEDLRKDPGYKDFILEPIEILGLDKFGDSSVVIKARNKTKPGKQWMVGREFNRRMKKTFDEMGIEIPFPHTTLYMGEDKQGESPPLRVLQEESNRKQ
jgi:moderate conductance mechanosensitive channel